MGEVSTEVVVVGIVAMFDLAMVGDRCGISATGWRRRDAHRARRGRGNDGLLRVRRGRRHVYLLPYAGIATLLLRDVGARSDPAGELGFTLTAVVFAVAGLRQLRVGLDADGSGITVTNLFTRRTVPWSDVLDPVAVKDIEAGFHRLVITTTRGRLITQVCEVSPPYESLRYLRSRLLALRGIAEAPQSPDAPQRRAEANPQDFALFDEPQDQDSRDDPSA